MLVCRLELHVHFLLLLKVLSGGDIEVDGHRLVAVNTAHVPAVGLANADLSRRDELIAWHFDGRALSDSPTHFEVS